MQNENFNDCHLEELSLETNSNDSLVNIWVRSLVRSQLEHKNFHSTQLFKGKDLNCSDYLKIELSDNLLHCSDLAVIYINFYLI